MRPARRHPHQGFTLLEVLIAIAIFAICVSTVYAVYGAMLSVINTAEAKVARNDQVRVAFDRLSKDLAGVHQSGLGFFIGREVDADAEDAFIEFGTTSHLSFAPDAPPVPLAGVRYYLRSSNENENLTLYRADIPLLTNPDIAEDEVRSLALCTGLQEIEVTYYNSEENEFSEWDSSPEENDEDEERFPRRVAIELVFEGPTDDRAERFTTSILLPPTGVDFGEGDNVR
jgi:type II secretion system protein J